MSTFEALSALVQSLQEQFQHELQSLRNQFQDQFRKQQDEIFLLRAQISRQPSPSPTRDYLPDPPCFTGSRLKPWATSIRAKIQSASLQGYAGFQYTFSRLEPSQQALVLHLDTPSSSPTAESLLSYLEALHFNPRERQEALASLGRIRMRDDEPLVSFLARYQQVESAANASSRDPWFRIQSLFFGLRPSLREKLEAEGALDIYALSYEAFVQHLQLIERREPRPPSRRPFEPRYQAPSVRAPPQQSDPMQIGSVTPTVRFAGLLPAPPPLTARERCERSALCFCCGSAEHWIGQCPRSRSRSRSPVLGSASPAAPCCSRAGSAVPPVSPSVAPSRGTSEDYDSEQDYL